MKAYREENFKEPEGNTKDCVMTVAISQNTLLADRSAMDDLLNAVRKIQAHSAELAKKA